jgi:hypothetical protein
MIERCEECGSWDAECQWEEPVNGCGCNRCLSFSYKLLLKENRELKKVLREMINDSVPYANWTTAQHKAYNLLEENNK